VAEVGIKAGAPAPLLALLAPEKIPSAEPQQISEGLHHVVIRPDDGLRGFLRDTMKLKFLADRAFKVEILQRFLAAAPAFAEMGILYRGLQFLRLPLGREPLYPLLILDAPATGHALAFASLPGMVLKVFPHGAIAEAAREGQSLLHDPARCAAVITSLPEPLPTQEALELMQGLRTRGIHIGAVIANMRVPDPLTISERAALAPLLARQDMLGAGALRRADQVKESLRQLCASSAPVLELPWTDHRGLELTAVLSGRFEEVRS